MLEQAHGLARRHPVPSLAIPEVEDVAEWETHRAGVIASLQPADYLELLLTERIAGLLWRLARVQRAERELLACEQETAEQQLAEKRKWEGHPGTSRHQASVRDAVATCRDTVELYRRFATLAAEEPLEGLEASELVWEVARVAQVDLETYPLPGVGEDDTLEDLPGWTAGRVWECIRAIAAANPDDPSELVEIATRTAERELRKAEREAEEMEAQLSRLRRSKLVLSESEAEKLRREETHLSRELRAALLDLEARRQRPSGMYPVRICVAPEAVAGTVTLQR